MLQQNISIGSLVDLYRRGELRLPEIQRQYVWRSTRVRDLLDSLYRGYPSGSILLWETDENVPLRGAAIGQEQSPFAGRKLLLDGQQRLTSLTAALQGLPIIVRGRKRPIDIAFNLDHPEGLANALTDVESDENSPLIAEDEVEDDDIEDDDYMKDGRLQNYKVRTFAVATRALLAQPNWISVRNVFGTSDDADVLTKAGVESFKDPRYNRYANRLKRLRAIKDYQYVVHVLERDMSYEEVTEIFVRVNSLGAKLRSSDLALAQMTSRWPDLLKQLERFQEECEASWSTVDLGQLARSIIVFATMQGKFGTVGSTSIEALKVGWEEAKEGLRFAINFVRSNAGIENASLLSSPMFLHVIAAVSRTSDNKLTHQEQNLLLKWLLVANARGRFGRGASEGLLNEDLASIFRKKDVEGLLGNLERQFGRLDIESVDLINRGASSPFLSLAYLALKHSGARDWHSGLKLSLTHQGKLHFIQWHHIFPKSLLIERGFENKQVNEIANMAFIGGQTNRRIGNRATSDYLAEVLDKQGPSALESQCVPLDSSLWAIDKYPDFLAYRRLALADRMNRFIRDKSEAL